MQDIQTLLGPSYASVGVGRDDGKKAGEYAPIFYRTCVPFASFVITQAY